MRILIVEDTVMMRKMIKTELVKLGHTDIVECENGKDAHEAIKITRPDFDLIISDWDMPKMNGIELLKIVRNTPQIAKTPFIMIAAEADQKNIIEAVSNGVSSYIVKPFTPGTLQDKVKKALGK